MTRRLVGAVAVGIAAAWMSSACAKRDGGVPAAAERAQADTSQARADTTLEPGALKTVLAATVVGWKGPDGRPFEVTLRTPDPASALARRFGTITMLNSLRTRAQNIGQFPCTSCHIGPQTKHVPNAHRIKAEHPEQTGAACSTCHSLDNVEQLALKSGERATLDHAYRLCAQCHFKQAEGWAAGAHGKRLDGWQGRRVVMGCADCHDPHKPGLEPRIPFRAPQLERTRGRGQ